MRPLDSNSAGQKCEREPLVVSAESSDEERVDKTSVDGRFHAALASARQGSSTALGILFEGCRNYLLLIANRKLGESIQAKIGASDVVQETLLQAQKIFVRFEGSTERELLAWLAQILELKHAQTVRRYVQVEMREVGRELPIEVVGSALVHDHRRSLAPSADSAIRQTEKREHFQAALVRLPDDYRRVIELRGLQEKSFAELADEMQRSIGAVRKMWIRAVQRLGVELRTIAKS